MGARPELSEVDRVRLAKEARWANRPGIMTEREWTIRQIVTRALPNDTRELPQPVEPTEAEELYFRASECFKVGRECMGWDLVEKADAIVGYDLG